MSDRGLRIGILGQTLSAQISGGVPRHIWEACKQLDAIWPEAQFFLYLPNGTGLVPPSGRWTIRDEPPGFWRKIKPTIWLKLRCGALVKRDKIDAFWSGISLLPRLPRNLPVCLTVHDLNIKLVPDTIPRFTRIAFDWFFGPDLRRADAVLAVSQGTADKLKTLYGITARAISPNGVGPEFRPHSAGEIAEVRARYNAEGPFCIAVGTIEPRKNILNLLRAFDLLDRKNALNGHKLLLVGKSGWKNADILETIKGYEGRWLRWLGYVSNQDLSTLYSAAALYVCPSIYEGFGIPVIEAMACGTQVAVTDIPELREYCGPGAVRIPGTRPEEIAAALEPVLQNPLTLEPLPRRLPAWTDTAVALKTVLLDIIRARNV